MKVLVVHPGVHFSVADVHHGLVKGLRANGCDVGVLNLDDRIEFYTRAHIKVDDVTFRQALDEDSAFEMAAKGIELVCYEWWPDIVIVVSGFYVPPKVWGVLARRPHHVVYWCTESPYEDDRQSNAARYVDTVILNDPTNLDAYRAEINPNTHYIPHSYDPAIHHPGDPVDEYASDFVFVGTGFPSRIEWLERVDWSGVDVRLGGNWQQIAPDSPLRGFVVHEPDQCMDNTMAADFYRSTKASLNLYRKQHSEGAHADGWAMGPREVELAACGTFFFREPRGEGDDLFPRSPLAGDPEDFGSRLRWWLRHDKARATVAERARAAIADRTFTNHAAHLLRLIEASPRKLVA